MQIAHMYAVLIINTAAPEASQVHCVSPSESIANGIAATIQRISLDSYKVTVQRVECKTVEQFNIERARRPFGSQAVALEALAGAARRQA